MPIDFLALIQEDDGRLLVGNRFRGEGAALRPAATTNVSPKPQKPVRPKGKPESVRKLSGPKSGDLAARIRAELQASGGKDLTVKQLQERFGVSRERIRKLMQVAAPTNSNSASQS